MNRHIRSDFVISPNGLAFRADSGEVYRLNATARDVLAAIEEGEDETRIAQRLAERHGLSLQRVRNDLAGFFETLETLNLLEHHEK